MSFSGSVKAALAGLKNKRPCCERAEVCAMLMFSGITAAGRVFRTEYECVALRLAESAAGQYGEMADLLVSPRKTGGKQRYIVRLPLAADHADVPADFADIRDIFTCDECRGAFLRGAFLVAGAVTDPAKEYRLEFLARTEGLASELVRQLTAVSEVADVGIKPTVAARGDGFSVSVKDSGAMEELLTFIGAGQASMEVMNVKIERDVRNRANREVNLDSANISRIVSAGVRQCEAIRSLNLAELPPELRELAGLRLENPDMSLSQLGASLTPPLSRSGVNHRLERLIKLAEKN